jgi:hypothetical protein
MAVKMQTTRIEHILCALPQLAIEERTFGIGSSVPIATQCTAAGGYSITSSAIATESSGQLREKFCHVRRSGSSGLPRSAEVAVFCTVKKMYSK